MRSTTAAAASAPVPSTRGFGDDHRRGFELQHREPAGLGRFRHRLQLGLLRTQSSRQGRVAGEIEPFLHADDGRQCEPVHLESGFALAARGEHAVGHVDGLDAVDDRTPERPGDSHADLKVAGVGRLVAEQHDVERPTRRSSSARMASVIARAVACGSGSSPPAIASLVTSTACCAPTEIEKRSCSSASGGPTVRTVMSPPCASTSRIASSTAHSSCGLVVNARFRASTARWSAVSVIWAPGAGTRFTHASTRSPDDWSATGSSALHARVVGIEQRSRPGDGDLHGVVLVHVANEQRVPDDRVFRRQVREQ